MTLELDIYIVSYKRPAVLAYTLDSINTHITKSNYFNKINLYIGVNAATDEYAKVIGNFANETSPLINTLDAVYYQDNMGKAFVLNEFARRYAKGPKTTILTMDEDMVFTDTFMQVFDTTAEYLKFDLVGFASKQFWGHYPLRHETMYLDWHNNYKLFYTTSIAGGIMMGSYNFLLNNKWTNVDGIYGGDDFNMCFLTDRKFIIEDEREWLIHDPIGAQQPDLEHYYAAKAYYRNQGLFVYPHNWYEDAKVGDNSERIQ